MRGALFGQFLGEKIIRDRQETQSNLYLCHFKNTDFWVIFLDPQILSDRGLILRDLVESSQEVGKMLLTWIKVTSQADRSISSADFEWQLTEKWAFDRIFGLKPVFWPRLVFRVARFEFSIESIGMTFFGVLRSIVRTSERFSMFRWLLPIFWHPSPSAE